MKKIIIFSSIGFVIILAILIGRGITGNTSSNSVRMGYCPTMQGIAEEIASQNENMLLSEQDSSAAALENLRNNNLDVVLIGRTAKKSEIEGAGELRLGSGYTLVSDSKKFIQKIDLQNLKIRTGLSRDIAQDLLPGNEIAYYDSTGDAFASGKSDAVLIDWAEFRDDHELVVVMEGNEKAMDFRLPILYSLDYDLNSIKVAGI